jgi:hypothetical protein
MSLQKMLEERNASDAKKDQTIANLQAQLEYLKQKMFGSTSELHKGVFPGQLSLSGLLEGHEAPAEEKAPEQVEAEYIEVQGYTKTRKPKATLRTLH